MTATFLQAELTSLIQDSKRRSSDVRTAAEKSLADLKAIQVTSETQLAADLVRKAHFVDPFILACNSKHVKLAVTGAVCLQRLIASRAIASSKLLDVLDSFQEATQQGLDVQLKILQALPSLLQLYTSELRGDALAKVLSLCASLASNKTALVSSTANATFQQLISTVFDRRSVNEKGADGGEAEDDEDDVADISMVFSDMCMVIKGEQPQFLRSQGLTILLALEVVEMALSSSTIDVLDLPSCSVICETILLPGITQMLEKSTSFPCYGRSLRTLYMLINKAFQRMLDGISDALKVLLHALDRPSGPNWKRVLCLEFMRGIVSDLQLLRTIYALLDCNQDKVSVIGDLTSILVRIAAEDPVLIGLGRQSTIPTNTEDDNATSAGITVDVDTVGSVLQAGSNVTGISSKWSTLGAPLLEQLERANAPDIPPTYIYTLVLGSVAVLSDGLSKFIMPLSVPNRASVENSDSGDADLTPTRKSSQVRKAEKYQRLLNPLKRDDLSERDDVAICAQLIEDCWPAILATCSTFLNSALDSHFYHTLVRTVQKLAQISGVLELFTPRDALLTTLAKVSVPVNAGPMITAVHGSKLARTRVENDEDSDGEGGSFKSPGPVTPRLSVDISRQPLNVRNLLCLRALVNLGIALGPTLSQTSWNIIIQALQQVDALMSVNPSSRVSIAKSQAGEEADVEGHVSLGTEIAAVSIASKRMMESTKTYSDESFHVLLHSVFKMIEGFPAESNGTISKKPASIGPELTIISPQHKTTRSASGMIAPAAILYVEVEFILKTISDLARINLHRFCVSASNDCTWNLIIPKLTFLTTDISMNAALRLHAANTLNSISVEIARTLRKRLEEGTEENKSMDLQVLCLKILSAQLAKLYQQSISPSILATDVDIHRRLLEALENIVSNSGEFLTSGWPMVFDILQRTTRQTNGHDNRLTSRSLDVDQDLVLDRTLPPAFRTVQLIVSDFLYTIDPMSFSILVQLLPSFGSQSNDLNISLTTTVLFSNLASLLLERSDMIDVTSKGVVSDPLHEAPQRPMDISSLWYIIILQLCSLCKDDRHDMRNSAIRVLIRILDSASGQLTSSTWNVVICDALVPILHDYCLQRSDVPHWNTSYANFLQGMVSLFVQNVEVIIRDQSFVRTWQVMIDVLKAKLEQQTLEGHTTVFSATTDILEALNQNVVAENNLAFPVLSCWVENHPARIKVVDHANQDAMCAHTRLLTVMMSKLNHQSTDLFVEGRNIAELAMIANKETLLASVHPPYSSDVTRMSTEQLALNENLALIQNWMLLQKHGYSTFIIDLVESILDRSTEQGNLRAISKGGSRDVKYPTMIAFMSRCITIIRAMIREEAGGSDFLANASIEVALPILNRVIATKYTNLPVNLEAPIWQTGTSAAVETVEAIGAYSKHAEFKSLAVVAESIAQSLEMILTAPALDHKSPLPKEETIKADEDKDIKYANRIFRASTSLIRDRGFPHLHLKTFVIVILQASLIAKPWFDDMPSDMYETPLKGFREIRPGSIRSPDYYTRTQIPYEALDMLLSLVAKSEYQDDSSTSDDKGKLRVAQVAAPYVLLRVGHTLKVFMADQYLRNLIPPPKPILHELRVVLWKALDLRSLKGAFDYISSNPRRAIMNAKKEDGDGDDHHHHGRQGNDDGKAHLRILYPLVLQIRDFWAKLPRLKVCAWQDEEEGKQIQKVLDEWGSLIAEG